MTYRKTYLTHAEAFNWGVYLHSDFRRLLKQREAKAKQDAGLIDFIPWTQSLRLVTKEDFQTWKLLHANGVEDFNDIAKCLLIVNSNQ